MFLTENKLAARINELSPYRYREMIEIPAFRCTEDGTQAIDSYPPQTAEWGTMAVGEQWKGRDKYVWLTADVHLPAAWSGKQVVGLFDFGLTGAGNNSGFESLLFLNGKPYQGVDSNHQEVFFPTSATGESVALAFRLWSGLEGGGERKEQTHEIKRAALAWLDPVADDLFYTARAVSEAVKELPEQMAERALMLSALNKAFHCLDWSRPGSETFYESVQEARHVLRSELRKIEKHHPVTVHCIGHTHIDVAWLWRLKHTREKSARSFSTVMRLMERYPEYVFLQTQPQLYDYLKTDYPELYAEIKERVREGRWEAAGGMWVEADCNLPSGESLVRQLLFGTRFFREEFGSECRYLWLPDVFGYSWALPQILRKSGIDTFMTTKISWNQYNRMPHDTFKWRGIDGSEVLTHFITTPEPWSEPGSWFYTYNGKVTPKTVQGIWEAYRDKEVNQELLLSYGYGDGGGGVNRDMLEMRRRMDELPGLPHTKTGTAGEFFARLHERVANTSSYVHTWDGELYLEYHRGTYTSQAYNKRMNRKLELLYRESEWLGVLASVLRSDWTSYRQGELNDGWKIILRNQFHDIIPGSSIREVYEDSVVEYAEAERLGRTAWQEAAQLLMAEGETEPETSRVTVFNSAPWPRQHIVKIPASAEMDRAGSWFDAAGKPLVADYCDDYWLVRTGELPPMGYSTLTFKSAVSVAVADSTSGESIARRDSESSAAGRGKPVVAIEAGGRGEAEADGKRVAEADGKCAEEVGGKRAVEGTTTPFVVWENGIDTPYYAIEWNDQGQLVKLYDRESARDVLPVGARGNVLQVFEDKPLAFDAWDIDIFYQQKMNEVVDLRARRVVENGQLRAVVRFEWVYGDSSIAQDMILYADSRRIDFATNIDWQERQRLLKVAFPVDIRATEATYDIQFGNVKRPTHWNTSWDYARFESVGHQWADLSERGYGVSLLNDCKYGYDIKDNVLRLSLLKSAIHPDTEADQGEHVFTYALLPHKGDWLEGNTVYEAWCLNNPLTVVTGHSTAPELSLFRVSSPYVMVDAVKKAEDREQIVLRVHDFSGSRGKVEITSDLRIRSWQACDLMEQPQGERHEGDVIHCTLTPYEIKTFLVDVRRQ
ncbi:alpha-mannosidase [Numidum massiliense]|uniref:alpha-mannosidase n=1 Tax=Numidum massiliense TaxID=1522315 RepID=UPI0006D5404A|nr:alpha-mannosidase [Numidum massiliense]